MSAIFGIYNTNGKPVDPEDLRCMGGAMQLLGPDGSGTWHEGSVGLGHLMNYTTPESVGENLPLKSNSGGFVITADARIDNREELLGTLGVPRPLRNSMPDSVIIIKAYKKWGQDCPNKLLGDFVFAIWDPQKQRLFCARDCIGCKSFFYYRGQNFFAFSSDFKGILALSNVPRQLDETRIADLLLQISAGETTIYKEIRRLPLMHAMSIDKNGVDLRQYWFPERSPEIRLGSDEEYIEAFKEVFFDAVRSRLRSIRPIGVMLSGGLDSASVACAAAKELKKRGETLHAFCSVPLPEFNDPMPSGRIADETPYIEAICRKYDNISVNYSSAPGWTPLTELELDLRVFNQPTTGAEYRYWIYAALEIARQRKTGALLTGQAGNFTISYNGAGYFAGLARNWQWLTLARELNQLCKKNKRRFPGVLLRQVLEPLVPGPLWWHLQSRNLREVLKERSRYLNPRFAQRISVPKRFEKNRMVPLYRLLADSRRLRCRHINPKRSEIADIWAAVGSHYGLEVRDPTADKRVVEFCLGIPDRLYIKNGWERMLIRGSMAGILPRTVRWRNDRGLIAADLPLRLKLAHKKMIMRLEQMKNSPFIGKYLNIDRLLNDLSLLHTGKNIPGILKHGHAVKAVLTGCFLEAYEKNQEKRRL